MQFCFIDILHCGEIGTFRASITGATHIVTTKQPLNIPLSSLLSFQSHCSSLHTLKACVFNRCSSQDLAVYTSRDFHLRWWEVKGFEASIPPPQVPPPKRWTVTTDASWILRMQISNERKRLFPLNSRISEKTRIFGESIIKKHCIWKRNVCTYTWYSLIS